MAAKKQWHWEWINRLANLQGLFSIPIMLGVSSISGVLAQSVPYISAFGLFGIFCSGLGTLLVLSFCGYIRSKTQFKKNKTTPDAVPTKCQKFIQWWGWPWLILITCSIISYHFFEMRPKLPSEVSPSSITLPIASYKELSKSAISGKTVMVAAMIRGTSVRMSIRDKVFSNCLIIGPAVLAPTDNIIRRVFESMTSVAV
jgi:hypothetical protein